jgi:hypothetical protein
MAGDLESPTREGESVLTRTLKNCTMTSNRQQQCSSGWHNHGACCCCSSCCAGLSQGGSGSHGGKGPEQDRNSCNSRWFWSLAVPVVLIVGVSRYCMAAAASAWAALMHTTSPGSRCLSTAGLQQPKNQKTFWHSDSSTSSVWRIPHSSSMPDSMHWILTLLVNHACRWFCH